MGTDQDESGGYQRQFNAAVSVIQNLPKNGSYKPSYDEMLRFYSYYKQATIGPCNISRPGFWDPIGRYKWDAWDKLGRMSRDDAMRAYINEMKMVAQKIINTFPLEEATPEMFEPFRTLYDVIPDMPRPPDSFLSAQAEKWKIEYGKNHNSDGENKQPTNLQSTPELQESGAHCGQGEARTTEPLAVSDGSLGSWGSGNEDFSDSLDRLSPDKCRSSLLHLSPQVVATVEALQATIRGLCQRLEGLEQALQEQQQIIRKQSHRSPKEKRSLGPAIARSQTLFFIFVWPFIVHWLLRRFYGRRS
ncbi:acyl-CoA-binding domain-containing protein 4 [Gastrophryne carolinensis]